MCPEEAASIARQAAHTAAQGAVVELFMQLGVNVRDPNQVIEFQRDLTAMRDYVRGGRAARAQIWSVVISLVTGGVLAALWTGIRSAGVP